MPVVPKPSKELKWVSDNDTQKIVEPSQAKKDLGFVAGEKPAYQTFNWMFNALSEWDAWLKEMPFVWTDLSEVAIGYLAADKVNFSGYNLFLGSNAGRQEASVSLQGRTDVGYSAGYNNKAFAATNIGWAAGQVAASGTLGYGSTLVGSHAGYNMNTNNTIAMFAVGTTVYPYYSALFDADFTAQTSFWHLPITFLDNVVFDALVTFGAGVSVGGDSDNGFIFNRWHIFESGGWLNFSIDGTDFDDIRFKFGQSGYDFFGNGSFYAWDGTKAFEYWADIIVSWLPFRFNYEVAFADFVNFEDAYYMFPVSERVTTAGKLLHYAQSYGSLASVGIIWKYGISTDYVSYLMYGNTFAFYKQGTTDYAMWYNGSWLFNGSSANFTTSTFALWHSSGTEEILYVSDDRIRWYTGTGANRNFCIYITQSEWNWWGGSWIRMYDDAGGVSHMLSGSVNRRVWFHDTAMIGRAQSSASGTLDWAVFQHKNTEFPGLFGSRYAFAVAQESNGTTKLNCAYNQSLDFLVGGYTHGFIQDEALYFGFDSNSGRYPVWIGGPLAKDQMSVTYGVDWVSSTFTAPYLKAEYFITGITDGAVLQNIAFPAAYTAQDGHEILLYLNTFGGASVNVYIGLSTAPIRACSGSQIVVATPAVVKLKRKSGYWIAFKDGGAS